MNEKEIRRKICELLNQCDGCERIKGMSDTNVALYCRTNCDRGKELYKLGKPLSHDGDQIKGRPTEEPKINLETYIELKREGLSDIAIINDLRIGKETLTKLKKQWGLPILPKRGDNMHYYRDVLSKLCMG